MRALFVAFVSVVAAGCYSPRIADQQFTCGTSQLCPSGFSCVAGVCRVPGAGVDQAMMAGGDLGSAVDDLWLAGLGDLDLGSESGVIEIDTDTGQVAVFGGRIIVPAGSHGFRLVDQSHAVRAGVFSFHRVNVPATVTVRPTSDSTSALVIAASQSITIEGTVDWQGRGALGGGRTSPGSPGHPDVGGGGERGAPDGSGSGGGGGGYAAVGGAGAGPSGGKGGNSYGLVTAVPLHVGAGGGGGGGVEPGGVGGVGGGGGGAVALMTLGDFTVRGKITVAGNDGRAGSGSQSTAPAGGGGGGAGGSLVLSAANLVFDAGHSLVATGGAGGAPQANGGAGGSGSPGHVWLGYGTLNVIGGTVHSSPPELQAAMATVHAFPR